MRKLLTVLFVLIVAMVAIPAVCVADDSSVSEGDVYRVSPSVEIILPAPMPAPEPMPEPEPTEDQIILPAPMPAPEPMPEPESTEDQDDSISEGDVYRVSRDVEISLPSSMPAPEPMPEPEPTETIIMAERVLPRPETPKMWSNKELTVFCELDNGVITVWTDGIESPRLFVFDMNLCRAEVLEPSGDGVYPTFRLEKPRGRLLLLAVFDSNGVIFRITI